MAICDKLGNCKVHVKLICGVCMVLVIAKPLASSNLIHFDSITPTFSEEANAAALEGINLAEESIKSIIKERAEAYILDKAAKMGLSLQVRITVSNEKPFAPEAIHLSGSISPYNKTLFTEMIEDEFSIPKEAQQWTS